MENNIRKELISYYKWIVSLLIFIITITISVVSASNNLYFSNMLKFGLVLSGISIFLNWLLIKRLIVFNIVEKTKTEDIKNIHLIFFKSMFLAKMYSFFQNLFFILGIILIIASFIFELNYISIIINL